MFSIEKTIQFLYPDVTPDEAVNLRTQLDQVFPVPFESAQWKKIALSEFGEKEVQLRLIKNLIEVARGGELGPLFAILETLENESDGLLIFAGLQQTEQKFYLRYYIAAATIAFEYLGDIRQKFLFGTPAFPLSLSYEPDFYTDHLQKLFARFCVLKLIQESKKDLMDALEANTGILGKSGKTISQWIFDFKKVDYTTGDSLQIFFDKFQKAGQLDEYETFVLEKILFMYRKLATDEVWKELTYHLCLHPTETEPHAFNFDEFYLKRLAESKDVSTWVDGYEEATTWLKTKDPAFVKKLLSVLAQKINFSKNPEYAEKIVHLLSDISADSGDFTNYVMYNESDGQFYWNKEVVKVR